MPIAHFVCLEKTKSYEPGLPRLKEHVKEIGLRVSKASDNASVPCPAVGPIKTGTFGWLRFPLLSRDRSCSPENVPKTADRLPSPFAAINLHSDGLIGEAEHRFVLDSSAAERTAGQYRAIQNYKLACNVLRTDRARSAA